MLSSSIRHLETSSTSELSENYDFVIIGGGTAGLTIALRLTEDYRLRVLVIEAGENRLEEPRILTPASQHLCTMFLRMTGASTLSLRYFRGQRLRVAL